MSALGLGLIGCATDPGAGVGCQDGKCDDGPDRCVGDQALADLQQADGEPAEAEPNDSFESAIELSAGDRDVYHRWAGLGRIGDADWYQIAVDSIAPDADGVTSIPLGLSYAPIEHGVGEPSSSVGQLCAAFVDSSGVGVEPLSCGATAAFADVSGFDGCCARTFDAGIGTHRAQLLFELPEDAEYPGTLYVRVGNDPESAAQISSSEYACAVYALTAVAP